MRQAIHDAAERLGPCWSISHLIGGQAQVFRVVAGDPERVQDLLAAEARARLQAPPSAPADLIVAGNHPWPGDPMQSFKVLLQHRAACRSGGVLVGLFWTDPAEIARSFPISALAVDRDDGRLGRMDDSAALAGRSEVSLRPRARQRRSCSVGHASWSSTGPCWSMRHRFANDSALAWALSGFSPINPRFGTPPPWPSIAGTGSPAPFAFASFPKEG